MATKKLLKRYIVEVYELTEEKVDLKEEVIPAIIKKKVEDVEKETVKNILKKRQDEISAYFNGGLPHNSKVHMDKDNSKKYNI